MTTFNFYPILLIVNVTVVAIRDKFEISVTQHSTSLLFFFFGHASRLAGSQFPDLGLNPGHGSESPES